MKFVTSINIERDYNKPFNYIVTANAKQVVGKLINSFNTGIHSFSIIGSYGTGKSSFILALENGLNGNVQGVQLVSNKGQFNNFESFHFLNIVGDYRPLIQLLEDKISTEGVSGKNFFEAFDNFYDKLQREGKFLFIVLDEFGKVLEHAAKNHSEKEMYFLQQFAEYVNDSDKNIIFITTLHQSFNAYAKSLSHEQKMEWVKVKGRLQEIVFSEPVEQLLSLAAERLGLQNIKIKNRVGVDKLYDLAIRSKFIKDDLKLTTAEKLYPMDLFAAYVMTLANQRYGQNERTLFTFLETKGSGSLLDFQPLENRLYNLADVHDYIYYNFYSFLNEVNIDSANWSALKISIERVEGCDMNDGDIESSVMLVKSIGLLNIFSRAGSVIDKPFLVEYASLSLGVNNADKLLHILEVKNIIRYAKYSSRYILFEGTDIDIEAGLFEAERSIPRVKEVVDKLRTHFDFKVSIAKASYYRTGTPRYFEYLISDKPSEQLPTGEVDGYINLIFSRAGDYADNRQIATAVRDTPVLFALFKNVDVIVAHLFEIDKLKFVLDRIIVDKSDKVAIREVNNHISYEVEQLNKAVIDTLFDNQIVEWIFNGEVKNIGSHKDLAQLLSTASDIVYESTPVLKNELINKHKPSGTISTARLIFLQALLENSEKEDLGFPKEKFPPEKSIYYSLLKNTGIHREEGALYVLGAPTEFSFDSLWDASEKYLRSTVDKSRKVTDLTKQLSLPPFGLKQGFIDFWVPIYLLIKREDYSLYFNDQYVPKITKETLELIQRSPSSFSVKAFSLAGVKLEFFRKYREAINLTDETELKGSSFIETIRPFLTFYKQLNDYVRNTRYLSPEAKSFRDTISNATDPELTFFELLPDRLGFKELIISQNPEAINSFVDVLQNAIRELRSCYDELISQIEGRILKYFSFNVIDFIEYKSLIESRYSAVNVELMPVRIKNFHSRLIGKWQDKKSWIESICYIILNKPLERIKDEEKEYLFTSLNNLFFDLDDYVEMSKATDLKDDNIYRYHVTARDKESISKQIIIPRERKTEVLLLKQTIENVLGKDKSINLAALLEILENTEKE